MTSGCPPRERLDAWRDGELSNVEANTIARHAEGCARCAAWTLSGRQLSDAVRLAARGTAAPPALLSRVARLSNRDARTRTAWWTGLAAAAAVVLVAAIAIFPVRSRARSEALLAELTDLHAANLASEHRVEVVSSDRHVVKPWFQGRLPFAVDFPEGELLPFELVGGRVAYVGGTPAAHLLLKRALHFVSVFVVTEGSAPDAAALSGATRSGYRLRVARRGGLVYFVVGDVAPAELDQLAAKLSNS